MEKPLHIPKDKSWKGLVVWCNRCKTNVTECKETGKQLQRCQYGDRHVFKVYVHVAGTANSRKTKTLQTRDINEAIKQAMAFEREVKENNYQKVGIIESKTATNKEGQNQPHLLTHTLARYIDFLHNEGVPAHRKKERTMEHIKDVERACTDFVQCLKQNGYDLSTISVEEINDDLIGELYTYFIGKGFANRTFNKRLSHLSSWMKWCSEEINYSGRNWFERINRRKVNSNPEAISQSEFESLQKKVTPENGLKKYASGVKPERNLYREWLNDGFSLALYTGRRREEVINLKFKDVIEDDNGVPLYIQAEDFKVNRIQYRVNEEEKKFIYIPVTKQLHDLLIKLNYEKYKNTDTYILAPEIQIKRTRIMSDTLSRAFSHYYEQVNPNRKLTFKSLRKTYITNLSLYMGGNAKAITQHSDDAVVERHYLDKKVLANAARNFNVFEADRKNELEKVRTKGIELKQQNKEVEI